MARRKQDWSSRDHDRIVRRLQQSYDMLAKAAIKFDYDEDMVNALADDFDKIVKRFGVDPDQFWNTLGAL